MVKGLKAAEYVRMSTDHQRYSTQNQSDAIRQYAHARSIEIVRTYADQGKSGLSLDGRDALKQLIDDVENGRADFETVLVYDVSRWGRFQDADESAYYEYICKRAGISVQYCAEQFENDGSPVSTIVKGVKRAMAGEYSRELSSKVFAGQCRLIELGYRQGGVAGFGFRRTLVDQSGAVKGQLRTGEHKSIQTDRVVLTPGPSDELEIVRNIYRRFVQDQKSEREISDELNEAGRFRENQQAWTRGTVHQILINEKYAGHNVWNRVSFKLKKKRVRNDPQMWVRADSVFPAIIDQATYDAAQTIIQARSFRMSNEDMLDALRSLRLREGLLSGLIIDEEDGIPSSSAYRSRFGSLLQVYRLVGFTPRRDYRYIEINRHLRTLHPGLLDELKSGLKATGSRLQTDPDTQLIHINSELSISVVIVRCRRTQGGAMRWQLRLDTGLRPDITVAIRMNATNQAPLDFYILPRIDIASARLRLAEANGLALDAYRFDDFEEFFELFRPVPILEAA
ncbi:recombinase family protein [Maricaulis alexandrii]|uniref:recombinase family protein n=1 Tax=Maricaulis alexandrii TaxID=2570354 RepID=UPI0022790D01|nr:recombinase family protein [Maricaulis alexandrii]